MLKRLTRGSLCAGSGEWFVVELLETVAAGNRMIVLENVDVFISDSELAKLQEILTYYDGRDISFLCLGSLD